MAEGLRSSPSPKLFSLTSNVIAMSRVLRLMVSMCCECEKRKKFKKTNRKRAKRRAEASHDSFALCAHSAFDVARERNANGREARTQTEKHKTRTKKRHSSNAMLAHDSAW
jgi:hypothetical protein